MEHAIGFGNQGGQYHVCLCRLSCPESCHQEGHLPPSANGRVISKVLWRTIFHHFGSQVWVLADPSRSMDPCPDGILHTIWSFRMVSTPLWRLKWSQQISEADEQASPRVHRHIRHRLHG